jgi:transposase
MQTPYYVGLDVHKKTVSCCVKTAEGRIVQEETVKATRKDLVAWAESFDRPWIGGMEATVFTGWIYDTLASHARSLLVGHPAMMRAIAASKKKSDRLDARKIADLVRCDLLPECYMAPRELRDLRRELRWRNFLVSVATRLKNKSAGLLMECGVEYNKKRLHRKKYFDSLVGNLTDVPASLEGMLRFDRATQELFTRTQKRLLGRLESDARLRERVGLLQTIRGVGQALALTWALEVGEAQRFRSIRKAQSYCGLCSALSQSANKTYRGPISKQRNKNLQVMLIEAAKIAPRWNPQLKAVHDREVARSNKNQATLAVARKLVAYLLYVDKTGRPFEPRGVEVTEEGTAQRTAAGKDEKEKPGSPSVDLARPSRGRTTSRAKGSSDR